MAQQMTSAKIEELRARFKAEPKSRHFFPLAEELRKSGALADAEQTLREGLKNHPNYLSAWIALGRVLKEQGKHADAIEALQKALTLDGGNVVPARLMAESFLAMGEKVEAIKKFKLVHALLPQDEEVEAHIDALDRELNPHKFAPSDSVSEVAAEAGLSEDVESSGPPLDVETTAVRRAAAAATVPESEPATSSEEESPFEESVAPAPVADAHIDTLEEPFGADAMSELEAGSSSFAPESLLDGDSTARGMVREEPRTAAAELPRADVASAAMHEAEAAADRQAIVQRLESWLARVKR